MYDYLVVGVGLYNTIFAHEVSKLGKKILAVDKRSKVAGNIYTEKWKIFMYINMEHIFFIKTWNIRI